MKHLAIIIFALLITMLVHSVGASKVISIQGNFKDIQSAIDVADPGDTIVVAPGTYKENIEIGKGITLKGAGVDRTKLLGAVVVKDADGVVIDGFAMDGHEDRDAHRGIWCSFSTLTISNNVIARYHHGITSESSRTIIENNSVLENLNAGIEIKTAIEASISENIVSHNTDQGILIALSEDNVSITDNTIFGNRVGIYSIQSRSKIRRNVIRENNLGVKSTQGAEPDLGTDNSPGLNVITDNETQIMNTEHRDIVQAKNNYWGNSKGPDIDSFDGKVDYVPWLDVDPRQTQTVKSWDKLQTNWGRLKVSF